MMEHDAQQGARGSRNEETRRRNLALMLTALHDSGPQSRSDLTAYSGLNRSTVGALVTELVDIGLVEESIPTGNHGVGRPSPVVRARRDVVALTVNPDRTAVTVALVGLSGDVRARETRTVAAPPTPAFTVDMAAEFVMRMADTMPEQTRLVGAGIAVPGLVDYSEQVVRRATHLGWDDVAIGAMVTEALGVPSAVANDANLGVIAEAVFGAGADHDTVVYLNGSSAGIGGGVVIEGRLLRGSRSYASELGHILVAADGVKCACGRTGCLETEVQLDRLWASCDAEPVGFDELDRLYATSTDPRLHAELDRQADLLARGIATLVSVFDPNTVILGGHVGALWDARTPRLRDEVRRLSMDGLGHEPLIQRNALRDRMMPIGAAELAFRALLTDPAGAPTVLLSDVAALAGAHIGA